MIMLREHKRVFFLFLSLSILPLNTVMGQAEDFSLDLDGSLNFFTSQPNPRNLEDKISADIWSDLLVTGRHNIGLDMALYYSLGGFLGYSRYEDLYGHLSDFAVKLAIGEKQPTQLGITFGRQVFSDPTGNIVQQSLDGINASLKLDDTIDAHFGVGYLGLLPANHNNIILSPDDENEKENTDWGSAPDRLLFMGDLSITLVPDNSLLLGLHTGAQIDLRESPPASSYSSWYVGVHSSGFIFELLDYRAQATLNGGHLNTTPDIQPGFFLSNYWSLTIPGELGTGRITLGIDFASGGEIRGFTSISRLPQGEFFTGGIDEILAFSWRIDWDPFSNSSAIWLRNTNIHIKGKHLWNTAMRTRTISNLQANASEILGHELSIGFSVVPLSDIRLEAFVGGIFGNEHRSEDLLFSEIGLSLLF